MTPTPPESRRIRLPFPLASLVARAARTASRATGRGGTAVPGKVLLALHPGAMRRLGKRLRGPVVCVSATNGKTTLTAMLAGICAERGLSVSHNMAGANLRSGVATTLLEAGSRTDLSLLETDEAALPSIARDLHPHVVLLGNLFRDQLDRYGELESIAERWRDMLADLSPQRSVVVYNADDPLIADTVGRQVEAAATEGATLRTVAYGFDTPAAALPELPHAADSKFCRRCDTPLDYARSYLGHLGEYRCPGCGFARPSLDVRLTDVAMHGLGASEITVALPGGSVGAKVRIPGLYNVYNAVGASAAAHALGLPAETVRAGLEAFSPAFGRFERVTVPGGGTLTLLLVKNPTGLNEVVRTLVDAQVDLSATLFALNDGIADGRDTSWVWDADVEPLLRVTPTLTVTGERAAEFGLRALYGGMPPERIQVVDDLEDALDEVLARARDTTTHGHAYALVTYTAMLRMRQLIAARGWVNAFWKRGQEAATVGAPTAERVR